MANVLYSGEELQRLRTCSCIKLACFGKSFRGLMACLYRFLVIRVHPFWLQLSYFVYLSFVGFLVLKFLNPRTDSLKPKDLDVFFMSVSSVTVSSMSTVEMEIFSNTQLLVITILMFIGGEVFTSMLGNLLVRPKFEEQEKIDKKVDLVSFDLSASSPTNVVHQIELGLVKGLESEKSAMEVKNESETIVNEDLKYKSISYLGYVVLGYIIVFHIAGITSVLVYLRLVPSARDVLKNKDIQMLTFSVFTIVSTFSNCGFVPTNENMIVFNKNSGLLLILIPQILLGNTLYPSCLRFVIWVLGRFTKKLEFDYLLKNTKEIGYSHLLPSLHSRFLVLTVLGLILVQYILFCCTEWNSEGLEGLNSYEKLVGALFQTVNSRHSGETIVDLSIISPAVLVLFVVMMYLPPYTSYLPIKDVEPLTGNCEKRPTKRGQLVENLLFSNLSYLVIFIILVCLTESEKMKEDPLNFNVLNIVIEVISANGNVGFSTGYSCKRQIKPDGYCKDAWYGFSGRWSNKGKLILILVMFFGRLKKFNTEWGKAWKLL